MNLSGATEDAVDRRAAAGATPAGAPRFRIEPILACLLGLALLPLKVADLSIVAQNPWAEDGKVFIQEVYQLGLRSLWTPYAGYLLLFPRLVAFGARAVSLGAAPLVLAAGWLLAFTGSLWVIARRALALGVHPAAMLLLIAAMVLQPHSGEVFFAVANAQWFLGVALALQVVAPAQKEPGLLGTASLLLVGLTGPFAILVLPALALRTALDRSFAGRKRLWLIVVVSSVVQGALVATSPRVAAAGPIDRRWQDWASAAGTFLSFGKPNLVMVSFAGAFWLVLAVLAWRALRSRAVDPAPLLALGTALLVMVAGWLSLADHPHVLSPTAAGERYFLIPYALVFFAAVVLASASRRATAAVLVLIAAICAGAFQRLVRDDRQWRAFTSLAQVKAGVAAPLDPAWAVYPGWQVELPGPAGANADGSVPVPLERAQVANATWRRDREGLVLSPTNGDPAIVFAVDSLCARRTMVVEAIVWRGAAGWAQLFWGEGSFREDQSLRRFYPEGEVTMQLGFRLPAGRRATSLRLDPAEQITPVRIRSLRLYCLDD